MDKAVRQFAPPPERHLTHVGARLVRRLRRLRRVRGWGRVAYWLVPDSLDGEFLIRNDRLLFAGTFRSYIDRQTYLFGQYEDEAISLFLQLLAERAATGTILDIGANVGTHSLAFAQCFEQVHAFEPNPDLWRAFERNMTLNGCSNVTLHRVGLGERSAVLPFYGSGQCNLGLGTFSTIQQYARPLERLGEARIETGSDYLSAHGIGDVHAMKIDVQGYEPAVLRGLRPTLERSRPIVWCEIGAGTQEIIRNRAALESVFPYPTEVWAIQEKRGFVRSRTVLEKADDVLAAGNYIVAPTL